MIRFGILTVSTTCSQHPERDQAGPKLESEIRKNFSDCQITFKQIVTDHQQQITDILNSVANSSTCDVLFTVGGTGFAPSDVTPEATKAVIEKEAPGLVYALISKSLAVTDFAMLSRPICGIKNKTIIINLPGSSKAAVECFGFIRTSLSHAVALVKEENVKVKREHEKIQNNFNSTLSEESKVKIKSGASRSRKSPFTMLEVADAKYLVFKVVPAINEIEEIAIEKAATRILAMDIRAPNPVPAFPASMKDGYAVRASDGAGRRNVISVTAAGDAPEHKELHPGEIVRISTGAAVPAGADSVVQVEDTSLIEVTENGEDEKIVLISVDPKIGQDIRQIGSDIAANTIVLHQYTPITPAYIGVLAMLGMSTVKVMKRPLIGVLSTGNELMSPKEPLKPGLIYDSNKVTLISLLNSFGYEARDCGIARDTPNSVKAILKYAFENNDFIVSSGGVSMSEYDLLKQVLVDDFDAIIHFGRLNMKPGKPTVFATLNYKSKTKVIFALPGNPVSCCVTSLLFVIPTLKQMENDKTFKGWPTINVTLIISDIPISNTIRTSSSRRLTSNDNSTKQMYSAEENITCFTTGRYPNHNDTTCKSYIYCYKWSDGKIGQYTYTCSIGLFNPNTQSCDTSYTCPCATESPSSSTPILPENCSAKDNFTCSKTGRFPNSRDITCKSYFYCYTWSDGRVGQYNYTCSKGLFNPDIQGCDTAYTCPCTTESSSTSTSEATTITTTLPDYCSVGGNFTCSKAGRFPNPSDPTCKLYYYCYVWSNGTIGQYDYKCAIGIFNPKTQSCDSSYTCPCTTESSSTSTSEATTITTTLPDYCSVGGNFTCSKAGRFPNPSDPTCKLYYYCYVWSNGTIGQYDYKCAIGIFNPKTQSCDSSYTCPCTIESSSTSTSEATTITTTLPDYCSVGGNFTCSKAGRFPNPSDPTCKLYYYCYVWSNGTIGQYDYKCAIGIFNPKTQSCDSSYTCPCTTESSSTSTSEATTITTTLPDYCSVGGNFTCSKAGRFPNPSDPTCKLYYYCYVWSNGTIGQYDYKCAIGIFNPKTQSCDSSYTCPCTTESSSTSTSEATTITTTLPDYCSVGGNFTCSKAGRFPNPSDPTCKLYYYCYLWSTGQVGQYDYKCSIGLFNPDTQSCDRSYTCPCTADSSTTSYSSTEITVLTTTEISTITSSTVNYCPIETIFTCVETGRFLNPNDTSCKSYIYCYVWSNGRIEQYTYVCSLGLFNPITQSCETSFTCPCKDITTAKSSTSITTDISTITIPKYCSVGGDFTCVETGRFPNPDDSNCKSYFYCYKRSNGTIGKYDYICSNGFFNPKIQSCDPLYECPCQDTVSEAARTSTSPTSTVNINTSTSSHTFTCVEAGKYPNPDDTSCKSYIFCYLWAQNTVLQFKYTCPTGLFNPATSSCVPDYVCSSASVNLV